MTANGERIRQPERTQRLSFDAVQSDGYRLLELVRLIPVVGPQYTLHDLLTTQKADGRMLHAKWEHSYVAYREGTIAGFVMGYEREADHTSNYPVNSLYISELAVDPEFRNQGIASGLLRTQLGNALDDGFSELAGPLAFSVQTNAEEWNRPVVELYESFGFTVAAYKNYTQPEVAQRTDVILHASSSDVQAALAV